MTQPGSEHLRRWPRHKVDVRLRISVADGGNTGSAFGRGNALSHGGMDAYIPCSIPVGATVLLEVSFPNSPAEVKVKAVVRNCEGFRYGLEFVEVPADVRTIIAKNCDAAGTIQ
jgi:hypothetical protein